MTLKELKTLLSRAGDALNENLKMDGLSFYAVSEEDNALVVTFIDKHEEFHHWRLEVDDNFIYIYTLGEVLHFHLPEEKNAYGFACFLMGTFAAECL